MSENRKGMSAIIAIVVIVAVIGILAAGGWYFMKATSSPAYKEPVTTKKTDTVATKDQKDVLTENLQKQGSSDAVAEIEKDVNASDVTSIDSEMGEIESGLKEL